MLNNFQLAAITKKTGRVRLLGIPLHQNLQNTLAESWDVQYKSFIADIDEVEFDAGYNPEEHERFCLEDYELPAWLVNENSMTVQGMDVISNNEALIDSVRSILAFARDAQGQELMLFQNFSRSHVIRPGRFLFLQNNTYKSTQHPGLTLEGKLSAVYLVNQQKLLFHSFRTTNTFLPLEEFYKEASEQDIREVLEHEQLAPEDVDALAENSNQWFRKRFAMLKDSGILDKYTARQIQTHSKGYEVDIRIKGGRIVFPADKASAKRLLQFLNEEIFRGAITETLYETNSKRESDS